MPVSKRFDSDKAVYALTSFEIAFARDTQFDPARPMGNVAMDLMHTVVKAAFVGLASEVRAILPKGAKWLREAIAARENFGLVGEYHLSLLNQALALAVWMQDGSIEEDLWANALREDQAAVRTSDMVYPVKDFGSKRLDHIVPMAVLSGDYAAAVSEYESAAGVPKAKAMASSMSPRRYAYEVAKSRLGIGDTPDLQALGDAALSSSIDQYLAYSNYLDAATLVCMVRSKVQGSTDAIASLRSVIADSPGLS